MYIFYSWYNYFSSSCFYFFIHSDQYEKGITEAKIKIYICVIFKAGVFNAGTQTQGWLQSEPLIAEITSAFTKSKQ